MYKKTLLGIPIIFTAFLFLSFQMAKREIRIHLKPMFGESPLVLEKEPYVSEMGDTLFIDLLRFYITDVELHFTNGKTYREKNSFHLIEFSNEANPDFTLVNVPSGEIAELHFSIGVDSIYSVSGALEGDLDPTKGMYWAWNSGYINAKMEGRSKHCNTVHDVFEFHIGGYQGAYKTLRKVNLKLKTDVQSIFLLADTKVWFNTIQLKTTNSILVPGLEASLMADNYRNMFKMEK